MQISSLSSNNPIGQEHDLPYLFPLHYVQSLSLLHNKHYNGHTKNIYKNILDKINKKIMHIYSEKY